MKKGLTLILEDAELVELCRILLDRALTLRWHSCRHACLPFYKACGHLLIALVQRPLGTAIKEATAPKTALH